MQGDIQPLDEETIKRCEAELLRELDRSPQETVTVNRTTYTRSIVLRQFQELKNPTLLQFHQVIHQHPDLFNLITKANLPGNKVTTSITFDTAEKQRHFQAFISPYLAYAFDSTMEKVIASGLFKHILWAEVYVELLEPQYVPKAFKKFIDVCDGFDQQMEWIQIESVKLNPKNFAYLQSKHFFLLINRLKSSLGSLPDQMAASIASFITQYRHSGQKSFLLDVATYAEVLDCNESYHGALLRHKESLRRELEVKATTSSKGVGGIVLVISIIAVLAIGIGLFARHSGNKQNHSRQKHNNQPYSQSQNTASTGYFNLTDYQDYLYGVLEDSNFVRIQHSSKSPAIASRVPLQYPGKEPSSPLLVRNETSQDMLMVIHKREVVYSEFIPSNSKRKIQLPEVSSFLFVTGKNWNYRNGVTYPVQQSAGGHANAIESNGMFDDTDGMDLQFLMQLYATREIDTDVVHIVRSNNNSLQLISDDGGDVPTAIPSEAQLYP